MVHSDRVNMLMTKYPATKDWPVVIEARKCAEYQLQFYRKMMEEKVANQRPNTRARRVILFF